MMTLDDGLDGLGRPFVFEDSDERLDDPRRLEQLRSTGLVTARHRPALDVLTHLAAEMTEAHAAFVMLVEADRQIAPSAHGPEVPQDEPVESPISHSFCKYVVINDAPLVVGDARTHPDLSTHPAVVAGSVVAYAGFPVYTPDGEVLGALCVMDLVPRTWTPAHLSGLKDLAMAVDTKIALRLNRRELHLGRERLMRVLDAATHTLIVIADGDEVIRTVNHAAQEALGLVVDDLGSKTLTDIAGAERPWRPSALDGSLDDAQDWIVPQHGELRTFSMRVNAVHDPEGIVDGYIVVGDDVSARRRSEDLLRDTIRKQDQAVQRLEDLDAQRHAFITTVSHELRTPVTNIIGYTELLASGEVGDLTALQLNLVNRLDRNGDRLKHLADDLLSLDQVESDNSAEAAHIEVDVDRLTENAWITLQSRLAGRDLTMTKEVPPGTPKVSGDLRQLERALLNLLTNAVKFTLDGGTVRHWGRDLERGGDSRLRAVLPHPRSSSQRSPGIGHWPHRGPPHRRVARRHDCPDVRAG